MIPKDDGTVCEVDGECQSGECVHEFGCTYTQGYWKTHTKYDGKNPIGSKRDDTWENVGEDTTFFLSQQSWYEVFQTEPSNDNGGAYYSLAHQYMAAVLNTYNPASTPADVVTAMADAKTFFETYEPLTWQLTVDQSYVTGLADTLEDYNSGGIGPGHCDEK